jgi:signal transduction histidine kinase
VGAVVGLTTVLVFEGLGPARAGDVHPGSVVIVITASSIGFVLSLAAVLLVYRLVLGPLDRLTRLLRTVLDSPDSSARVAAVDVPSTNGIGTEINRLINAIKFRDETIDRHELMERNLQEWMKKRSFYELELKGARVAAEDANKTKSHFLASVSHELRTPLHTIMSYARFGERDIAEGRFEDAAEYFEVIADSSDLLLILLNDLLNLSKLESGKLSLHPTPTRLGDIVGCATDQCQMDLKERGLEVVLDVREPDLVFVDPTRTLQVARNLIENAIKYTRSNSSIFVDVYPSENNVTLRVRDQGTGVPEDELDSIFDSFKQASNTGGTLGGVGLGLTIARQIVVSQKGRIWANNHAEGGLVVTVQFAAHDADVPPREQMSIRLEGSQIID